MASIPSASSDVALFASDMHLGDHDPATAALFLDALARHTRDATHLFLLGDLFDAWVGDDQRDAQAAALIERLSTLAAGGLRVFVMRGNRDFLLDVPFPEDSAERPGTSFSARARVTMLADPSPITLFGQPVLVSHGDALCSDDLEYQAARRQARSVEWQHDFLGRPLDERLAIARELRQVSRRVQAARALEEFGEDGDPGDVNSGAVEAALREARAFTLIHGHTHRPACHRWALDGEPAQRWVLPDWRAARSEDDSDRGGFLRVDASGWTTISV